jgi:hypothetical protein
MFAALAKRAFTSTAIRRTLALGVGVGTGLLYATSRGAQAAPFTPAEGTS